MPTYDEHTAMMEFERKEDARLDNLEAELVCNTCKDRTICESREHVDSWVYSDQFALCCDLGVPEYHDTDYWVCKECTGGVPLTPEEEEQLAKNMAMVDGASL
jgi:hypothetical protein